MGLQPLAIQQRPELVKLHPHWVNSDVLHNANIDENLRRFFEVLKDRDVVFVGPDNLREVDIEYRVFQSVPIKDCWLKKDLIVASVLRILKDMNGAVVLFCASMAANVMIDEIYKEVGDKHTLIDAGSIFDVHVGNNIRSYHHKMKI